ncbi:MAG TPA: AAA family ATPase [Gaiellaceae bacterium]|nr:AAA family ATPase [Gaiellaceae bacterium]
MAECPSCGRESADDARFCSGCGSELPLPGTEELRKTVTVVFCDLVGSTSLGERLDPESVRRAVGRYFDEARVAIERHGGTVEKFIGDAVMSVFGIPRLHEDDALRAVRAASELRDAVIELGDELEAELGARIEARIGVATGEVVAGDPSSGQAFVTGDVVNVAARLEQAAGPGEVLIGERTLELVRDAVRAEPAGPLTLKGKAESVAAWRLLEVTGIPKARGLDAPFVGRASELDALSGALARAVESRSCQLCTIVGPPGIGKSRIAEEFTASALDGCRVVVGRCLPYGEGITYWPLAEIVEALGGESGVRALLSEDESADLVAQRVFGAVGTAEPSGAPEETFWAFRRLFEALAREQPLIAVVDELQWAEPTLLDLLEYLLTFAADQPILVLCMTRPELFDERPSWAAPRRGATVITLEPLGEEESATLVETLATARGIPEGELPRILETAEGNPLFLEQLLAHRADSGNGHEAIPPTLQALLAARIDRLDADERAVLVRAAVEGKTFHRGAVTELLPEQARPMLGARLISLVRQELIRADRSQFPGDDGFRFGHSLIHDAAYEAASKELRAEAHERYADWLEVQAGEHLIQYEEILGYHLERAHRLLVELGRSEETLARRAGERLASAGERALARADVPAALNLLGRSLDLVDAPAADVLYSLGVARSEAGDLNGADEALSAAIERAEAHGDLRVATRATVDRLGVRELTGRAPEDEARDDLQRMIPVLERLEDDAGLAKAWIRLSKTSETLAGGAQAAERALLHARRAGLPREEEDALFEHLTAALYGEPPVAEVTELCQRLLAEAHGPLFEVGTLEILGALKVRAGEVAEGHRLYERADQLYRELGMKYREAVNWSCWAHSELAIGDYPKAEAACRMSIEEFEAMGDWASVQSLLANLAHALCAQGRHDEAASVLDRYEDPVGGRGIYAPSARARVLAARGELDAALALAREAAAAAADRDWPEGRAQVLLSLAEVLERAGRPSEEAAALREALALYERKGITPAVARVRARLDELEAASATA